MYTPPVMIQLCVLLLLTLAPASAPTVSANEMEPIAVDGVQQLVAYSEHIISGAKPSTPIGFESLSALGVRTILCVDGVAPDSGAAEKFGIATIHIPLKYSQPTASQILDIVTAVSREYKQHTIYIHCHKGKHRSAVAAAIACIALGECTVEEAKERMLVSETSIGYTGLWNAVELQKKIQPEILEKHTKVFPSQVQPEELVDQMIDLENALDAFERIQIAHWKANKDKRTIAGAEIAGMMADTFRVMNTDSTTSKYPPLFQKELIEAISVTSALEEAILKTSKPEKLDSLLAKVEHSCISCHDAFRE
jgi:protein-tyrosine phosphatase